MKTNHIDLRGHLMLTEIIRNYTDMNGMEILLLKSKLNSASQKSKDIINQ